MLHNLKWYTRRDKCPFRARGFVLSLIESGNVIRIIISENPLSPQRLLLDYSGCDNETHKTQPARKLSTDRTPGIRPREYNSGWQRLLLFLGGIAYIMQCGLLVAQEREKPLFLFLHNECEDVRCLIFGSKRTDKKLSKLEESWNCSKELRI